VSQHFNVLFLCTGNSARSIMAEAILNSKPNPHFTAYSAGSLPSGAVHPEALKQLHAANLPTEAARSKSWEEFSKPSAPGNEFRFHRVRQRSERSLSHLARPAHDSTLGNS
jgi:arsenate reductase